MEVENNIPRYYLKNVYFITGTAYAGKSTTVKMLANRYYMIFITLLYTREEVCDVIAEHF